MKTVYIKIDQLILDKFPDMAIGYMVVGDLQNMANTNIDHSIKEIAMKGVNQFSLTIQNLVDFKTISDWRKVYSDCDVKPKTYKSSIESLLRRFIQKDYKPIIPIVDLYNYLSSGYVLSGGGYNLDKIEGTLALRFGKSSDRFIPLNGKENIALTDKHIVYADDTETDSIICWMWNHKDSRRTMLTNEVTTGLFIFDALSLVDFERLKILKQELEKLFTEYGCKVMMNGIINRSSSEVEISYHNSQILMW